MRPPNFKKTAKKAAPVLSRVNTATLQPGTLLQLTGCVNGFLFPVIKGDYNKYNEFIADKSILVFLGVKNIWPISKSISAFVFLGEHKDTKQPVEVGYEQWVVECLMKEVS